MVFIKQVYVQLPTSANNVTLLASAIVRHAAAAPGRRRSISPARRSYTSTPAAAGNR